MERAAASDSDAGSLHGGTSAADKKLLTSQSLCSPFSLFIFPPSTVTFGDFWGFCSTGPLAGFLCCKSISVRINDPFAGSNCPADCSSARKML